MAALIPWRPKTGAFQLKEEEKQALSYYVLSGCPREEAFTKFVRPDFIGSRATPALKAAVSQFFATKDAKDYMEAYRSTIQDLLHPKVKAQAETGSSLEEKKSRALTKLVEYVLSEANNIDTAEDPKAILDFANKIGLFDVEEQVEELPRRYLPVSCGECEYRKFVEENCEEVAEETNN